MADNKQYLKTR